MGGLEQQPTPQHLQVRTFVATVGQLLRGAPVARENQRTKGS